MANGTDVCDRCDTEYGPLDDMRMWSGEYDAVDDPTRDVWHTLCNDCYRELYRQ